MLRKTFAYFTVGALVWLTACGGTTGDDASSGDGPSGGSETGGAAGAAGTNGGAGSGVGGGSTGGSSGSPTGGKAGQPATGGTAGSGNAGRGGAAGKGGSGTSGGGGGTGGSSGGQGSYTLDFVGNITTNDAVDTDGKVFSRHWNQITPENAGKWGSVQASAGAAFNWRTLDAIYDYAQRNNVIFKQHAFVWGRQQPSGTINQAAVQNWISEFCRRYPNTALIDVVNEPPPHTTPSYVNAIGGGTDGTWQWITNSFVWAHASCPNAVLILNDYSTIEYASEATRIIDIVNTIKAAGAPIDAVGAQAHSLDGGEVGFDTVRSLVARISTETRLPLYITEMDISTSNDQEQLRLYQQYFPFFRDSGYVKGLTIWGWIYGKTWSDAPESGLVRNGTSRPAMTWLMQQLGKPVP